MRGKLYPVGTTYLSLCQIAVSACVSVEVLRGRLRRGMDPERAATLPALSYAQAAKRRKGRWHLDKL